MESSELDLSNINIKTHELDLDSYLNGLIEIKKDIDNYKGVQSLMYKYLIADFSIFTRNLSRGFETDISKKWQEYFNKKQKELEKKLEEMELIVDRFDFENSKTWKEIIEKKLLDYYFPNEIDFSYINKLRKTGFEVDFNDYKLKTKLKSIPEKLIIQSILENITYNYTKSYKEGEPLQMAVLGKSRESISMYIGMDLGKYDMVKYLKNRLNEIENGSNDSQKHNKIELSYDDIFTSIEAKEKAFNAMIELGMIDKNYNYLMDKNRSFMWTFIDECIKKGMIFNDESIKRTPKSVTFARQLKLIVERPTDPNDGFRSRIKKVLEK